MPFSSIKDLPDQVKNVLPEHGQEIYKEAFNSAYEEYKKDKGEGDDLETTAHKVAWSAVKNVYEKGGDEKWLPKMGR